MEPEIWTRHFEPRHRDGRSLFEQQARRLLSLYIREMKGPSLTAHEVQSPRAKLFPRPTARAERGRAG